MIHLQQQQQQKQQQQQQQQQSFVRWGPHVTSSVISLSSLEHFDKFYINCKYYKVCFGL